MSVRRLTAKVRFTPPIFGGWTNAFAITGVVFMIYFGRDIIVYLGKVVNIATGVEGP